MHFVTVLPFALIAVLGSTGVQAVFNPAPASPYTSYLVQYDTTRYGTPEQGAVKKFGTAFHGACVDAAIKNNCHHVLELTAYQETNTTNKSPPWVYAFCGGLVKKRDGTWDKKSHVQDLMDVAMASFNLTGNNNTTIIHRPDGTMYPPRTGPTPKLEPTPGAGAASPVPGTPPLLSSTPTIPLPGGHGRNRRKGEPKRLQDTGTDLIIGDVQPFVSVDALLGGIP